MIPKYPCVTLSRFSLFDSTLLLKHNMPVNTGLPEFSLANKVVLVSGGARGLGLTQAEALLEAGAKG